MRFGIHRAALGTWLLTTALLLGALTGCKTADLYRSGYDKRLTQQTWATRAPDDAVVIIGGYRSVWQKADDPSYTVRSAAALQDRLDPYVRRGAGQARHLSAADAGAGRRQLRRVRRIPGAGSQIRRDDRKFHRSAPGEVVYVGDLDALVLMEGIGTCAASLSVGNSYAGVVSVFAKQVPYVGRQPTINLMMLNQPLVRFPCGQGG